MGRGGCEGTQRHDGIVRFMNHRPLAHRRYEPTHYEHAANCATHALWIMPSALGGAALHWQAGDGCQRLMAWVYGVALCALFTVSTAFHTISWKKSHLRRVEHCFHMFDRVIIYFFIAGTYAPWLNLRELGPWAVHMRWLVWLMAAVGSLYIYHFHERHKVLELVFYSIMAICPALVILSMIRMVYWSSESVACFTHWVSCSSKAMDACLLRTLSGTFLSLLVPQRITMPHGDTCISHMVCSHQAYTCWMNCDHK
uniref:monocyte to macrophage differentiation factor 2-like isoform X3 n=1 Tax=Myxine glutinosa TaxID=7769 RepID=UPI00358F5F7F